MTIFAIPVARRTASPVRGLVTAPLLLIAFANGGGAQELRVTGTVVDSATATPVYGARIVVHPEGAVLSTAISDSTGAFTVTATGSGFSVSITAMGMAEWHGVFEGQGLIDLGVVPLEPTPYEIEGFEVTATSICRDDAANLNAGFQLLGELRPALARITANDHMQGAEYVVEVVRTVREPLGWEQVRWRWTPDTVRVRIPFAMPTHEVQTLFNEGFAVAVDDSTNEYRAPSAAWLGAERLQEAYCLAETTDRTGAQRRGVRFWPKQASSHVDVEGTLWVAEDSAPVSLEFNYVGLKPFVNIHELPWLERFFQVREGVSYVPMDPVQLDQRDHGGTIIFREVSDGRWLTAEWEIRGVRLAHRAEWERGELSSVQPRTAPLLVSGRVLAIIPGS